MASKRRVRRRSCDSKVRHTSKVAAQQAIRGMQKKTHFVVTYKCKFCKGWHIGQPPQRRHTRR